MTSPKHFIESARAKKRQAKKAYKSTLPRLEYINNAVVTIATFNGYFWVNSLTGLPLEGF